MTCAKVRVIAKLLTLDGEEFVGENLCNTPQQTCPRGPGEGYEKCKTICKQPCHAEVAAINACTLAGSEPRGGSMTVSYYYFCDNCQRAMNQLGIRF